MVSDLNKNFGGSADLHTPIQPPPLRIDIEIVALETPLAVIFVDTFD